ncbi:MAG: hypothetical protein ACFFAS_18875 [Promethearchaeota archaeon]
MPIFKGVDEISEKAGKMFKINDYIFIKLEERIINIYVAGEMFR